MGESGKNSCSTTNLSPEIHNAGVFFCHVKQPFMSETTRQTQKGSRQMCYCINRVGWFIG